MFDETEDITIIQLKAEWKKKDQPGKPGFPFYINKKANTPDQQQEFTIDKWTSPVEPQGYIKGRDNDCL